MITRYQKSYIEKMCELNYQQWKAKELLHGIPEFVNRFIDSTVLYGFEPMTGMDIDDIYDVNSRALDLYDMLPWDICEAIGKEQKSMDRIKCSKFLRPYVRRNFEQEHEMEMVIWWNECYELCSLQRAKTTYGLSPEDAINIVVEDRMYSGDDDYSPETIKSKMKFLRSRLESTKGDLDGWKQRAKHIIDVPEHK